MKAIKPRELTFLAALGQIRPATINQLDTLVGCQPGGARASMHSLVELGLVRKYLEPIPKRTYRERELGVGQRRSGKRPWIYELTMDGVGYLEGAAKCSEILRVLEIKNGVEDKPKRTQTYVPPITRDGAPP